MNTGPARRTDRVEVVMWLATVSLALAQASRADVEIAPPELWVPAWEAWGWTARATPERFAVAELPIGPRSVSRVVATAPGVRAWTGDVLLDSTSIAYAGSFPMVRGGPATPSRLRGP